jgi:hypothetical protein
MDVDAAGVTTFSIPRSWDAEYVPVISIMRQSVGDISHPCSANTTRLLTLHQFDT